MKEQTDIFDQEGNPALGFDTGLTAAVFARSKGAEVLAETGVIVCPDGKREIWKPEGTAEQEGTMVVYGPHFAGERLDVLLEESSRKDRALDALRYWLGAILSLGEENLPVLWPAGALVAENGALFFAPERLHRLCLDAGDRDSFLQGAARWVNPSLQGFRGASFTAAALTYRIFAGFPPYQNGERGVLGQDMRENNYIPLSLAAAGLDAGIAAFIEKALDARGMGRREDSGHELEKLRDLLQPPGAKAWDSFFSPLPPGAEERIALERERFLKRKKQAVTVSRFVRRNRAVIAGIFAALFALGLVIFSIARSRQESPSTKGMTPFEVIQTYYEAIGNLDHARMEDCVVGKAGKGDIDLITNYYVLSRVRMSYEMNVSAIPAQAWLDEGGTPVPRGIIVTGVTGLHIEELNSGLGDGEARFWASYWLWLPSSVDSEETAGISEQDPSGQLIMPEGHEITDELRLRLQKDEWRIVEINRHSGAAQK
ncbi:MAG: hypothetical protein LBS97_00245 [Treponema sp.]|jgi:hypothetical protein|nr:hypothetical protein [Treponema sp.]